MTTTQNTAVASSPATHVVNYRGVSRECSEETFAATCEDLIKELGAPTGTDYPKVSALDPIPVATPGTVVGPAVPTPKVVKGGEVDEVGAKRSLSDEQTAIDSGFAPAPPVFQVGTRVIDMGVQNARAMQLDHDAKPLAKDVATELMNIVKEEKRADMAPVNISDLRMTKSGEVALAGPGGEHGRGIRMPVNQRAFTSLMQRFPCRSGIAYLNDCPTILRSINFNHWAVTLGEKEQHCEKKAEAVLRTREVGGKRQTFAAVSPSYTAFDADKIGEALRLSLPDDARGSLDYDGQRMRLESLWRTDVAPEEFVAGEFFKAGVIVRADDTGAGSIRVQSVLWRNLCLNLIILDKAIGVDIRIRHLGSVEALAARFRAAFAEALTSVDGFRTAWGYAMEEKDEALVARSAGTTSDDITGLPASVVLGGLFNGILDRDLVPVRGRKTDVVPKLLEMHRQDEAADAYGVSRASVVNAFTRYAHQVESDSFEADAIREGAGKLLSGSNGRAPAPLPYSAFAI